MSEFLCLEKVTAKIKQELERACFLAFSDIEATEKQLHGNSCIVVNKTEAEAIFANVLGEWQKQLRELQKIIDEMFVAWKVKKIEVFDSDTKETWIVKTLDPDKFQAFYDALDKFLVKFRELQA